MVRPGIREYFRLRPRGAESIREQVEEEIALHMELRVEELIARGMDPDAARAEAERRFGRMERARLTLQRRAEERERRMSMGEWLAGWRQDFAYSARALRREPVLAAVVIVTLALGIGANATIFGIVDQLLLRGPAHVEAPEQVKRVYVTEEQYDGSMMTTARTGYVTSTLLREQTAFFEDVAVLRHAEATVGRGEQSRRVMTAWASPALFGLLGVQPAVGRFFTEEEDRPGDAQRVVVLEHGYWQTEYGGSAEALGRQIMIDDAEYTIIGVAPRRFTGPDLTPVRLWLPFGTSYVPRDDWQTTWQARWLQVLVRVKAGTPVEQANARATAVYRAAAAEANQSTGTEAEVRLLPTSYGNAGTEPAEVTVSRWLVGVSLIVLVVACANVVNMLLARALRRRRELAVRLALGVSRGRLARLLLTESMLLAVAGGLLALALVTWGGTLLRTALLPDVLWDAPLNVRVLLFSAIVVTLTALVVGLAPALQASRADVSIMLKSNSAGGGSSRSRLRGALTVVQTAMAVVLLVGAGLFVRSLWNVHRMDLGIEADRVLGVWTQFQELSDLPPELRAAQRERQRAFARTAVERLRARPDVAAAAIAGSPPMSGATMSVTVRAPGRDSLPRLAGGGPYATAVSDGYFETTGTRILRGRGIESGDRADGEAVVVVNETMARTLWPDSNPLDQCLYIGRGDAVPCFQVVGVAQDARRRALVEEPAMQYYVPLGQGGLSGSQILVRPVGSANSFAGALRSALHEMDPRLSAVSVDVLTRTLDPQVRPWRLGATMFLVFGALALLISAIGLYSVIAYGVAQRRTELGVRVALGAGAGSIVRMILRQGVGLVLLGLVAGVPLALLAGRRIETLLFNTSARDPGTFAFVAVVLLVVAVVATVVPAARAGRTDPLVAMRAD